MTLELLKLVWSQVMEENFLFIVRIIFSISKTVFRKKNISVYHGSRNNWLTYHELSLGLCINHFANIVMIVWCEL